MLRVLCAAAAVMLIVPDAPALVAMPLRSGAQRAITADVVCVGKVTTIEKDTVDAAQFPGAPNKVAHKIAVVKIETPLAGATGVTHIKVGFVPAPPPVRPNPGVPLPPIRLRPGLQAPELKEGQEFVFFLSKHPSGDFYMMPNMSPPIAGGTDEAKKEVEKIKKVLAVLADPMKGLKSDKADERFLTATTLIAKYRTYPNGGTPTETPIPVEESQLILKGLLDSDWTKINPDAQQGTTAFYSVGLTVQDGWMPPKPTPVKAGEARPNYNATVKDAFAAWLAGPGKTYQIKKFGPK